MRKCWQNFYGDRNGQVSRWTALICAPALVLLGTYLDLGHTAKANPASIHNAEFTANVSAPTTPPSPSSITAPAYTYRAVLTKVYDADTWRADVDLGFNTWRHNEPLRLYGVNAPEIRRSKSKGVTRQDVQNGFDCRDIMLKFLGLEPENYARKAKLIDITPPIPVIIETIKDKQGKYGRMLAIIHKDGVNLNQILLTQGCAH